MRCISQHAHTFQVITYTPGRARHGRSTAGPGQGRERAQGSVSTWGWHGGWFWSIPEPRFTPPGQQMPPATFCRAVPSRAGVASRPTAWHGRAQIPCAQRDAPRAPEMDSASLCQALTTLPACISLSPVFHSEMVSFPSPFFAPGHKQSRTKDERKMQWGGVRRGRDI